MKLEGWIEVSMGNSGGSRIWAEWIISRKTIKWERADWHIWEWEGARRVENREQRKLAAGETRLTIWSVADIMGILIFVLFCFSIDGKEKWRDLIYILRSIWLLWEWIGSNRNGIKVSIRINVSFSPSLPFFFFFFFLIFIYEQNLSWD